MAFTTESMRPPAERFAFSTARYYLRGNHEIELVHSPDRDGRASVHVQPHVEMVLVGRDFMASDPVIAMAPPWEASLNLCQKVTQRGVF